MSVLLSYFYNGVITKRYYAWGKVRDTSSYVSYLVTRFMFPGFLSDDCDDTIVELSKLSIADAEPDVTVLEVQNTSNRLTTARDYVLRRCNQTDAILFDECYPDT